MLFDEPHLRPRPRDDPRVSLDVMISLAKSGMTMVVVTHEMGFVETWRQPVVFMGRRADREENAPGGLLHPSRSPSAPRLPRQDPDPLTHYPLTHDPLY